MSKSVRDFGCPRKYCTGPACSDDEQTKLEKVEELANTEVLLPPTGMVLIIALLPNLCITVSHTKVEDNKQEQGVIINCYGNLITQVKFISPVYCYFH